MRRSNLHALIAAGWLVGTGLALAAAAAPDAREAQEADRAAEPAPTPVETPVETPDPGPAETPPEGAAEGESAFFETVDVTVVNVEVFVTDKKGNPITGLGRDDFEILEDGRPVAITNFYAVESGRPVAGAPPAAPAAPSAPKAAAPAEIPAEQRLNLIVYIDNFNIRPFNRNRVFRRLREFLHDKLDSEDRVMLVTYDRSLHVRHGFTTDSTLIANALFELEEMTGHGIHQDSERRDVLRDIEEAESMGEVQWRVRQYAESLYNDLSFSISAVSELVRSLAGLEGRKALLYVSDGLPMSAGEDLYHALQMKFHDSSVLAQSRDFHAGRKYRELAALANANRVTFYTIDAAGLRVYSSMSAERATAARNAGMDTMVDSINISNLQSTLRFLADETGGLAIVNSNDVGPGLERIAGDFDTYYSLGYTPSHAGDNRYYNIKVKVDRKGVDVRHREGYRDKGLHDRMADSTVASLMYGMEKNPLNVAFRVGTGNKDDEGKHFLVPIEVDIPISNIVLVPREQFHEGRLRLFFSAIDEDGDMADVSEVPIDIRIPSERLEEAREQPYRYQVSLRMREGGHRLAVGVRDLIGAAESFVTRSVVVGSG